MRAFWCHFWLFSLLLTRLWQKLLQPLPICLQPDDHFVINDQRHGRSAVPAVYKFIIRAGIGLNVPSLERDASLPQKLLGRKAMTASGMMIQDHPFHSSKGDLFNPFLHHRCSLPPSSEGLVDSNEGCPRSGFALSELILGLQQSTFSIEHGQKI